MSATYRRRVPPTDPDIRIQQRLADQERVAPGWSNMQTSDGAPLRVIRGVGAGDTGTVNAGGGWSYTRFTTGVYIVTFTTAFSAAPSVVGAAYSAVFNQAAIQPSPSTTGFQIQTYATNTSTYVNSVFSFIAIGPA